MDETRYELMYRRPGAQEHENITDVLDDILIRLERIEAKIDQHLDDEPGLTD